MINNGIIKTGLSAAMHFLVDGLCLCCLFLLDSFAGDNDFLTVFLYYNVLAFLTQPFSGLLADALPHPHWQLLASVVLLLLGVVVATFSLATAASTISSFSYHLTGILLGLGNSLFHTWGGKQTAVTTDNDIRALGVFVSTGAFGIAVSLLFHSWSLLYTMLIAIGLLALTYLYIDKGEVKTLNKKTRPPFPSIIVCLCLIALMLAVMLRSYVGERFSCAIPSEHAYIVLLIGFLAMAGKMAGGGIARWFGVVRSLFVLVALVAAHLLLKGNSQTMMLCGLFAVNCTMPITLYLANVVMPRREGLAFGLLAAALMPGYLMAVL